MLRAAETTKAYGSRNACLDQQTFVSGSANVPGIATSMLAGIPGRGSRVFLAADDNHGPEAGLGGIQAYLAEARSGQLAGQILGLVAGETVGGVPARCGLGHALGEHQAAGPQPAPAGPR
jgi:hypothetical protein